MKYINSDFQRENLILRRTPTTKEETYNKLVCLRELEAQNSRNPFVVSAPSKRRNRLFKMYWAFSRKGDNYADNRR